MAHEIEIGRAGTFNYFEAKDAGEELVVTAWHKGGHAVPRGINVLEGMETIEANYTVERRPTYRVKLVDGVETVVQCETAFITVRTDKDAELGRVGPTYEPIQNADAFGAIQLLIDEGLVTLETGGVLRDGANAWMMGRLELAKMGELTRDVFDKNGLRPYGLWSTDHTGRANAKVANVTQRVVCANTHRMADAEMKASGLYEKVRHTGDATAKMREATEKMFGGVRRRFEIASAHYLRMMEAELTPEQFGKAVLDAIVPDRTQAPDFDPKAPRLESSLARDAEKRQELTRAWEHGVGHTGDHSAWEAFQGAVQVLDHNDQLFKSGNRLQSLFDGQLQRTKEVVLDNILELVSVPTSTIDWILRHHENSGTPLVDQILAASSN